MTNSPYNASTPTIFLEKRPSIHTNQERLNPINVLLVEDDEDDYILTRDIMAEMQQPACHLEWASTFEAGLHILQQQRHDLYLFDFRLGTKTGLDLLRIGMASGCHAPIILLTGSGGELVAVEALRLGAADYITKSLMSTKTLHRAMTNALEKAHLRQTLTEHQQHLEHTNQVLKKQNKEIQRFYHTLAHELKTPLTAVREFTSLILDGLAGPLTSDQEEYLRTSLDCIDQITSQINDLLDVTRLDTGKLSLHRQPENLEALMAHVVATMKPAAEHRNISLSMATDLNGAEVWIDKARIGQVLTNLLSNAIKFTPPGGSIEVEAHNTREQPICASVSVRDTGCGIAPEHLEHIFDRLFQVEEGHSRQEGGLGLGLTIAREIVRLHGGQIFAQSLLGQGTQFTFTIPGEIPKVTNPPPTHGDQNETQNSAC